MRTEFGYDVDGEDIGECWGIAAHENGDCKVCNGAYAGYTLSQLWTKFPELFGNVKGERFPLLVKILDAREDLSIQVHPGDEYARRYGLSGKSECWYILECEEDSTLIVGHNAKTKEELQDMIYSGRWQEFIREIPVKKGDFIQIDHGTVHAIKGGILIMETQQNSDTTYRVYDYDRLSNGKPRELHVEKSLEVIRVPAAEVADTVKNALQVPKNQFYELINCKYYKVYKIEVDGGFVHEQKYPFLLMSVIDGNGEINGHSIAKGDHFIVPNECKEIQLNGKMQIIASTI